MIKCFVIMDLNFAVLCQYSNFGRFLLYGIALGISGLLPAEVVILLRMILVGQTNQISVDSLNSF